MKRNDIHIEIDEVSGFCFGVVNAITKAEQELKSAEPLYSLGDIVHNEQEVSRLNSLGLRTIDHEKMKSMRDVKVLLRAHGEPPSTYELARRNNIDIIDASCPVVLALQKKIKNAYADSPDAQIVIYGKRGHAEVLGLVGQTDGSAIVVEDEDDLDKVDFSMPIILFSQTTKSVEGFNSLVNSIQNKIAPSTEFKYHDTICRQVANRIPNIQKFAERFDVILFVSGAKSSNGKVLFEQCRSVNERAYLVSELTDIREEWFAGAESIGICGATSTPKWLMNNVFTYVKNLII